MIGCFFMCIIEKQDLWLAVGHDISQFVCRQPPIERYKNGTKPGTGKQQCDRRWMIEGEDCNSVTARNAMAGPEHNRDGIGPFI